MNLFRLIFTYETDEHTAALFTAALCTALLLSQYLTRKRIKSKYGVTETLGLPYLDFLIGYSYRRLSKVAFFVLAGITFSILFYSHI